MTPNEKSPVLAITAGLIFLVGCLWVLEKCCRLVTGRKNRGGLMSPKTLRVIAVVLLLLPVAGLFTGYYRKMGSVAIFQAVMYVSGFLGLRALAREREANHMRKSDPVFGLMLYMGDKLGYWEGKAAFPPTGTMIEVFVDGSAKDSMDQQHKLFECMCGCWSDISSALTTKLRQQDGRDEAGTIQVTSISIPNTPSFDGAEWELSFIAQYSGRSYTARMKAVNPELISWDS